jgi:adenylate cyclase class IV
VYLTQAVKYAVPSLVPVGTALRRLGATVTAEREAQADDYYATRADRQLRLRRASLSGNRVRLWSPSLPVEGAEVDVGVAPVAAVLDCLGHLPVVSVQKFRETWAWGDVNLHLDSVKGIGRFVEVFVAAEEEAQAKPRLSALATLVTEHLRLQDSGRVEPATYPLLALGEAVVATGTEDRPGEEWRVVPRYPWMAASTYGRVRSRRDGTGRELPFGRWRILEPLRTQNGYRVLTVLGKTTYAHWLVLEAFHGPRPPGTEAAFKVKNKNNLSPDNLEYRKKRSKVQEVAQ